MRHYYKVAINKMYFPRSEWPRDRFTSFMYVWKILAGSRTQAVQIAWEQYRLKILKEVLPTTKAISLDCDSPTAPGNSGLMNRLMPIRVWELPKETPPCS